MLRAPVFKDKTNLLQFNVVQIASSRIMDVDYICSFINKTQRSVRLDPWLIMSKIVISFGRVRRLARTNALNGSAKDMSLAPEIRRIEQTLDSSHDGTLH